MPSSNELFDIAAKSLQTGALTGMYQCFVSERPSLPPSELLNPSPPGTLGAAIGAGSGILRNAPPTLFALFAGLQWFALGSSFMGKWLS